MSVTGEPTCIGPEYQDTGDPEWFETPLVAGGAHPGDIYAAWGRWRERIPPTGSHPADTNQHTLCRMGFRQALARLHEVMTPLDATTPSAGDPAATDATARAMVATYETLEWVHSFDEYLRKQGTYAHASDLDPVYGPYVEGAIGARNASHHGVRRVLGIVQLGLPVYKLEGRRWVHTGSTLPDAPQVLQVRWIHRLPGPPLHSQVTEQQFNDHLAGREVRNTFAAISAFFYFTLHGNPVPENWLFGPAANPPGVDPNWAEIMKGQTVPRSAETQS